MVPRDKLGTGETQGRPASGWAKRGAGGRDGLPPKAFGTGAQSASGASTFSAMQGRPPGLCTPAGYQARPHQTLVRVQGIRRKAQGKKLIPDPRPLTPATFIPRSRLGVTPLQSRPPCQCSRIAAGLSRGPPRGSRSHSVRPHRADTSERRTGISAVAAGGLCIMRAILSPIESRASRRAETGLWSWPGRGR